MSIYQLEYLREFRAFGSESCKQAVLPSASQNITLCISRTIVSHTAMVRAQIANDRKFRRRFSLSAKGSKARAPKLTRHRRASLRPWLGLESSGSTQSSRASMQLDCGRILQSPARSLALQKTLSPQLASKYSDVLAGIREQHPFV